MQHTAAWVHMQQVAACVLLLWLTVVWVLTAYAFLLRCEAACSGAACVCVQVVSCRVPSECLPIVVGGALANEKSPASQAEMWVGQDELVLRLKRRKNRVAGSRVAGLDLAVGVCYRPPTRRLHAGRLSGASSAR